MKHAPPLTWQGRVGTRSYLQDVAKVLGKLQQAFLPVDAHDWQRGLVINMRGLYTQDFSVGGETVRAGIDFVTHKVRFMGSSWPLAEFGAPEMMNNLRAMLESRGLKVHIEEPEYGSSSAAYDAAEGKAFAEALWYVNDRFQATASRLSKGLVSPILLYPHHFDVSLVWYPHDDERQTGLGWSTGDATIAEPYFYLTAYPEPADFQDLRLPAGVSWQAEGFSGAVLRYNELVSAENPDSLFKEFAGLLESAGKLL